MRGIWARSMVALAVAGCAGVEAPGSVDEGLTPVADPVITPVAKADAYFAMPSDPQEMVRMAFARHESGEYALAVKLFRAAVPSLPVARSLVGRSLMEEGRLSEAYTEAVQAVREVPDHTTTQFVLGLVAARDGRPQEAEEAYRRVLELDPAYGGAHNNLGGLFYLREDFRGARDATELALQFACDDESRSIAESNLGELDALAGKLDSAEARYDNALEATPDAAHPYFALATLYDVTGRDEAALRMAEQGQELDKYGATRRATSFVWPELELHNDALMAEARADLPKARALWTRLANLETQRSLKWPELTGRATAHLLKLGATGSFEHPSLVTEKLPKFDEVAFDEPALNVVDGRLILER